MGARPFAGNGGTELACEIVFNDKRPQRPMDSERLGFTNEVWELLRRCWENKSYARPSIEEVSTCLERATETWVVNVPAFLLASKAGVRQAMDMKEDQAQDFVNNLEEVRKCDICQDTWTWP